MSARISSGAANANMHATTAIYALNLASISIGKVKMSNLAQLVKVVRNASKSPLDERSSKHAKALLTDLQTIVSKRNTRGTSRKLNIVKGLLARVDRHSTSRTRAPGASVVVALSDKDKEEKTIAENRSILAKFGRYGGDYKHIQFVPMSSKPTHEGPDVILKESALPASPRRQ